MALNSSEPTKGNPPSFRLVPSKSTVLEMCAIASETESGIVADLRIVLF